MKTFSVEGTQVVPGITVEDYPFWRLLLGQGGPKNYSYIPVGNRDAETIIENVIKNEFQIGRNTVSYSKGIIKNADILNLKNKPWNVLLVKEKRKQDAVLVFWTVRSGYKGTVNVTPQDGAKIIKCSLAWQGERRILGTIAHTLAILNPGQTLHADITGIDAPPFRFVKYDGNGQLLTSYLY